MVPMNFLVLSLIVLSTLLTPVELRSYVVREAEGLSKAHTQQKLKLTQLSGKHSSLIKVFRSASVLFPEKPQIMAAVPPLSLRPQFRDDVSDPSRFSICHHFCIPPPYLLG